MTGKLRLYGATALLLISLMTSTSFAQKPSDQGDETPLLINADELKYETTDERILATGNVEIYHTDRILYADQVSYSQTKGIVTAKGNVKIVDKSGDIFFADEVELTDDLKQGFVDAIKVLMADDTKFAADSGDLDGSVTTLNKAVYSPCQVCEKTDRPLWRIRARQIFHDQESRDIIYKNARFEVLGVPIAYAPHFSHPDPTVKRRTGFLAPTVGSDSDIGYFVGTDYYIDIDPDKDMTLSPKISEEDGLLLGAEWRQRFEQGELQLNMAGVVADRTLENGTVEDDEFRGYLFADSAFDLTDTWRAGLEIRTTTDEDFLRRYNYSNDDILENKLYLEYLDDRDYANIASYYFEDLRPEATEDAPLAVPVIQWNKYGQAGKTLGGRWMFGVDTAKLERSKEETDSFRLSTVAGWQKETFHSVGLITSLEMEGWIDGFSAQNIATDTGTTDTDDLRFQPIAQIKARYPFSKNITPTLSHYVEPIAAFTATTSNANDEIVPNEDSRDTEFDHTNLFSLNRFTGRDRVETGRWVSWGVRTGINDFSPYSNDFFSFNGGEASVFLGQSYHFDDEGVFAEGSGLEDKASDYVGNINLRPNKYLNLDYSFRLDSNTFSTRKHDLDARLYFDKFKFETEYLFLDDTLIFDDIEDREELSIAAEYDTKKNWRFGIEHTRDLTDNGGSLDTSLMVTYYNECISIEVEAKRDGTNRSDLSSGDSIYVTFELLTLGNINPSTLTNDLFGEDN